jgi:hypothetical protein
VRLGTAALLITALVVGAACTGSTSKTSTTSEASAIASPIPLLSDGPLTPGQYAVDSLDPSFDASHRITFDVPDGYRGVSTNQTVSSEWVTMTAWVVGGVYADPCSWKDEPADPSATLTVGALAATLASQKGLHASTPTDTTVAGFAGKYLERSVPADMKLARCDEHQFRLWLDTTGGQRYVDPGAYDQLWIVDVDGVPLLLDAAVSPKTPAHERDEILQIMQSVKIDPR